ncbi:type 1 fimbrial protein, partial [Morganella morganii]|nr:type 1 fimbrial protein [Morganella morganii]
MNARPDKHLYLLFSFNAFSADGDVNEIAPEVDVDPKEITGNIRFTGKITDSSCDITLKDKDVY